jgi:hypothetical protein
MYLFCQIISSNDEVGVNRLGAPFAPWDVTFTELLCVVILDSAITPNHHSSHYYTRTVSSQSHHWACGSLFHYGLPDRSS